MQEELFETEDCDDISELITKTELSTSKWEDGNYDVSKIKNVEILQEIIKQKDSKLILSAEIGSRLLQRERKLNDSNNNLQVHVQSLEDEVRQLKFEQKNYKQKRGEDEEAMRTLLQRSNSVKIERSKQLQEQVKVLREDVQCVVEELMALQTHVQQEVDGVREMIKEKLDGATTEVVALGRKVESIQNRYTAFDCDTSSLKNSIQDLASHCLSQEENIESLNMQIQEIKRGRDQGKKEMGNLIFENDGLRKVLSNLRERLKAVERGRLPRVLRHVNDATSPYIDSRCLAQEIEQTPTSENYRFHKKLSLQPTSYYSNFYNAASLQHFNHPNGADENMAVVEEDCSSGHNALEDVNTELINRCDGMNSGNFSLPMTPSQLENLLQGFERLMGEEKLGQPGRVGSQDLNLVVQSRKFKQSLLQQCHDYNNSFDNFFKNSVRRIDDRLTDVMDKSHRCTNNCNTFVSIHNEITHKTVYNINNNSLNYHESVPKADLPNLELAQVNTNDKSKAELNQHDTQGENRNKSSFSTKMECRSSRLIDNWAGLWECSVTDALKTKSGVWIKGSQCNDYFIEEDFSNLEEDESFSHFNNLLKADSYNNITMYKDVKTSSISDLNSRFVDTTNRGLNGVSSIGRGLSPSRPKVINSSISISSTPTTYPNTPTISICNDSGYENEIDSSSLADDMPTKKLSKVSENIKSNTISTTPKTTSIFFRSMSTSRPQLSTNRSVNDTLENKSKRPTYFNFPSSSYEESSLLKKLISSSSFNTQFSPFSFSMDDLRASPIQHHPHKYSSTNNFLETNNCTITCKNQSNLNTCLKLYPCNNGTILPYQDF